MVHGVIHCRLSNICPDGKWIKDERFFYKGREIVREKGQSAGKLMLPWRRLRKSEPELFKDLSVYMQPAGYVDSVIQVWMIEELSELYPQALWQRDCFSAAFSEEAQQALFLAHHFQTVIGPKMTASLQLTDTDFSKSFKAQSRHISEKLQTEERKKAKAEGRRPNLKMGPKEILQISQGAQKALFQKNLENQWVLAGARRNYLLSYRPSLKEHKLVRADSFRQLEAFDEGSSRLRLSWYENRYKWLDPEGKPIEPNWSLIDKAASVADLVEYDYCRPEVESDDQLVLETEGLTDGYEDHAEEHALLLLSPALRRAKVRMLKEAEQGGVLAKRVVLRDAKRQRKNCKEFS